MTVWIIEPQDPLIVRDGRPFGPNPGARARSLPFPFPSTTTGAARTRAGQDGNGRFDPAQVPKVERIRVRGPLLIESTNDGDVARFLAPAPGDALPFDAQDGKLSIRRLVPLVRPAGAVTDLDDKIPYLVGLTRPTEGKPAKKAPAFWYWETYEKWLLEPVDRTDKPATIGVKELERDRRMHVAIDPATLTGRDGALFMTDGITFWRNESEDEILLSGARRLALAIAVDDPNGLPLTRGFGPMGGERRLMHWRATDKTFPAIPPRLKEEVLKTSHCRVILLTPAHFVNGWKPDCLTKTQLGVSVELQAAIVGKPETVSGWDLKAKGPKPTRRLVPAGSVFFLKLTGNEADIGRWLDDIWFQCISDTDADRGAGFGLAAVGVYSGVLEQFTIEEDNNAQAT